MICSMTGYGVSEGISKSDSIRVEIRSVNSRYFDFSVRLPSVLIPFENDIKKLVNAQIKRGKVSLFISINKSADVNDVVLNEEKAIFFITQLRKYAKKNKLSGDIELRDILSFPDIFAEKKKEINPVTVKKNVMPFVEAAVVSMVKMRKKEGANILKDFKSRISKIGKIVKSIELLSDEEPLRFKKRIEDHIKKIDKKIQLNSERLEQEIAYLADKADITEEIVRLRSHCEVFSDTVIKDGEAGKRLEFIAQEMNREANTIASKSQNARISEHAITIKLEIEKIREQVQNIE